MAKQKPDQAAKHEDDIKKLATAFFRYATDKYNDDNMRILDNFCSQVELDERFLYGNKISKDNPLEVAPGVFLVGHQFIDIVTNDKGKKQIEAYKQKQVKGRESAKKLNEQMSKERDAAIQEKEEPHPTKKSSEFSRFMLRKPLPRLALTKSGRLVVRK